MKPLRPTDATRCPKCEDAGSHVTNIYLNKDGYRHRRRECIKCRYRWTTIEVALDSIPKRKKEA